MQSYVIITCILPVASAVELAQNLCPNTLVKFIKEAGVSDVLATDGRLILFLLHLSVVGLLKCISFFILFSLIFIIHFAFIFDNLLLMADFKQNFHITRARGYKTFFMLNSADHEISNAHKYKISRNFSLFHAHISL